MKRLADEGNIAPPAILNRGDGSPGIDERDAGEGLPRASNHPLLRFRTTGGVAGAVSTVRPGCAEE
jgi:hypothetical protein